MKLGSRGFILGFSLILGAFCALLGFCNRTDLRGLNLEQLPLNSNRIIRMVDTSPRLGLYSGMVAAIDNLAFTSA